MSGSKVKLPLLLGKLSRNMHAADVEHLVIQFDFLQVQKF